MSSIKAAKLKRQQRHFFVGVGLVLISIGAWKAYKLRYPAGPILLSVGAFLLLTEFFVNELAAKLFAGWMKFAQILAKVNTTIILTLIYFTMIWPIAVAMRLFTKEEPEAVSFKKAKSSWVPLSPPQSREQYLKPY